MLYMSYESEDISKILRYSDAESIKQSIIRILRQSLESEDEIEKRRIRRIYVPLPYEIRSKIKIAALQALKEIGYWDPEIFDSIFLLAKNDPDYEIRRLAEETIIAVLRKTNHKKESLLQVLNAINKREILISPIDAVKASGIEAAEELLKDKNVSKDVKELIKFCLEAIKNEKS